MIRVCVCIRMGWWESGKSLFGLLSFCEIAKWEKEIKKKTWCVFYGRMCGEDSERHMTNVHRSTEQQTALHRVTPLIKQVCAEIMTVTGFCAHSTTAHQLVRQHTTLPPSPFLFLHSSPLLFLHSSPHLFSLFIPPSLLICLHHHDE